ncbi:MAG TPA: ATP-binding protein, partial [Kofleriaceae bacterium]|nr:ATP-binding protein [Kofleriaceae bacterium]
DIKLNVAVDSLDGHISEVLESLQVKELEVVDRAGRWHRLQIRPYYTVDGKLDGAVISLTDIDRLKQAAGEATAALDQMSAVLDTIRVPLIVLDETFSVRSANPAYYEAYGGDPSHTIGQIWFDTCDGAWDDLALRAALDRALAGNGEAALEIALDWPPGSARTIAVSASVLRWGGAAPLVLITSVDITERMRLLEKAEEARVQAVRASSTKDIFLATLSHELRGPLHVIALHADLLLAGAAAVPERARSAAQAIARSAEGLERIIGDLLDVSAIIAGKISLKRKPVDLRAVVATALDAVRVGASRKRIDLRLEADPDVAPVVGDETRLQQVVGNLLTNAVKFTPPEGHVVVELEQVDSIARVRITDSGQGIARDFLPHVFDRFAQADASNARTHGGLGLGLAIVRDLVRLHGGTVGAESDGPGTGASFTVELPSAASRAAGLAADWEEETDPSGQHRIAFGAPAAETAAGELEGMQVLLVDDDAGSRDVLSEMLGFHGAQVRAVSSAEAAMTALAVLVPDVLVCDIAMPDEDGYSLIQRIRTLPAEQGGQVAAVAVTALATRSDRHRALAAGFQLHLAKPAPIAALCDAIRRASALATRRPT